MAVIRVSIDCSLESSFVSPTPIFQAALAMTNAPVINIPNGIRVFPSTTVSGMMLTPPKNMVTPDSAANLNAIMGYSPPTITGVVATD